VQNSEQGVLRFETERAAYTANIEVQVLEGTVLGGGNAEKTSHVVQNTTGCRLAQTEGIY
jgi:hypothetical protein